MSQVDPFQWPNERFKELQREGHGEEQANLLALAEHFERQGNSRLAEYYHRLAGTDTTGCS